MEAVDCALKRMGENVSALQTVQVPGLANWGQDKLTECQSRWDSLSKQVGGGGGDPLNKRSRL